MDKQINFPDAKIGFRNFAGAEGAFNKKGDRNFCIFLDKERAAHLEADGWNVKHPKAREMGADEEDTRNAYLPVSVSFDNYPAKVIMIAGKHQSSLGPEEVEMLDWAEIAHVDAVVRPYNWSVNNSSGVKAYLKAIYVTIETDAFTAKYGI